jgi:hypothetical protein
MVSIDVIDEPVDQIVKNCVGNPSKSRQSFPAAGNLGVQSGLSDDDSESRK